MFTFILKFSRYSGCECIVLHIFTDLQFVSWQTSLAEVVISLKMVWPWGEFPRMSTYWKIVAMYLFHEEIAGVTLMLQTIKLPNLLL